MGIEFDMIMTVTSVHGHIAVGDQITQMRIRHLTRWERFMMWNNKPLKWPPRQVQEEHILEVKSVISGSEFEIEHI